MTSSFSPCKRPLVIVGAGGHAVSVCNVALSMGYEIDCFLGKEKGEADFLGYRVIEDLAELGDLERLDFAIALGDNADRENVYKELIAKVSGLRFPPLVHKSAVVSSFSEIAEGTVVMPQAVIGPNSRVGRFCLLNTRSSIDHDCAMLDFSSLAPAAVTGGRVKIGRRSAVSINAAIKQGITIGDDCVVGSSSYLNEDLPDNQLAYGTPARPVRTRKAGDSYLK